MALRTTVVGSWWKLDEHDNFIDHMQRVLHGFEIDKPDEPDPLDYDDLAHAVIIGEISASQGLGYAAAYRRESKPPGGIRKATPQRGPDEPQRPIGSLPGASKASMA